MIKKKKKIEILIIKSILNVSLKTFYLKTIKQHFNFFFFLTKKNIFIKYYFFILLLFFFYFTFINILIEGGRKGNIKNIYINNI